MLEAIGYAQKTDARFKAAQENHRVSVGDIGIARTRLFPSIGGEVIVERDRTADEINTKDSNTQEIGLALIHPVFNKPLAIEVNQALLKKSVADAQIQVAYEDLISRVVKAYVAVLQAQSEREFRQLDFSSIERQLLQIKKLFRLGSLTSTDVAEITAQQDQALAAWIEAKTDLAKKLEDLSALTGLSVSTPLAKLDLTIPLAPPNPNSADAWVAVALKTNLSRLAKEPQRSPGTGCH